SVGQEDSIHNRLLSPTAARPLRQRLLNKRCNALADFVQRTAPVTQFDHRRGSRIEVVKRTPHRVIGQIAVVLRGERDVRVSGETGCFTHRGENGGLVIVHCSMFNCQLRKGTSSSWSEFQSSSVRRTWLFP